MKNAIISEAEKLGDDRIFISQTQMGDDEKTEVENEKVVEDDSAENEYEENEMKAKAVILIRKLYPQQQICSVDLQA